MQEIMPDVRVYKPLAQSSWKNTWLPLIMVGFAGLATIAAIQGMFMLTLAAIGLVFAAFLLFSPDAATILVVFMVYTNLAVLGVRFHGLPSITAMLVPVLLLFPLFYYLVIRREKIIIPSSLPWLVLFMVVLMVSTILSRDVPTAFEELTAYFTEGLMLFVLITNVFRSSQQLRWVIWVLLAAGILLGGVPLYQQVSGTFDNNYGGLGQTTNASFSTGQINLQGDVRQVRLAGAVGEMNRFAQVMLMLVPLGLMRFWGERSPVLRILALATTAVAGIGMALPFSRGAAVAFVLMVIAMVFFRIIKPLQLIAFVLVAAILLVAMPQYAARLVSISSITALFNGGGTGAEEASTPDGAILGRATEMIAAARVYADHPIFGVGPGMFPYYSREYSLDLGMRYIYENREAHNLILGIAAESGSLGIILFLGMLTVTLRDLFKVRRDSQGIRPDLENYATSFLLVLIAYLATGLFLHLSFMRYFWLMFALASSAAYIGKTELAQTLASVKSGHQKEKGLAE